MAFPLGSGAYELTRDTTRSTAERKGDMSMWASGECSSHVLGLGSSLRIRVRFFCLDLWGSVLDNL